MEYNDTKLIVFLKTFSPEELSEFEKFLTVPYFRRERDLLPFLKTLKKYYPEFSGNDFSKENIFRSLYPDSDYSDKKSDTTLRTLSSYLTTAAEEFLFISRIRKNKILKNRIFLEELLDRNLTKYYEQYISDAYNDLKFSEDEDGSNGLENFYLERLNTRYYSIMLDFKEMFRHNFKSVEMISGYFWIDLLRTAKTKYLAERHGNIKPEANTIDNILENTDMEKILETYRNTSRYIYLAFNYYSLKCLTGGIDLDYYKKAKKVFFENKSSISTRDKNFFYADLINILISGNTKEELKDKKEEYELIKSCLKDKAYKISKDDFMQPDFYRNALLCAVFHNDFKLAEDFVNEYSSELKPEFRDNMKFYSLAMINFSIGKFEESLDYVSKVKYDLVHFKIDLKVLMLKIFYELNLTEQVYSLTDTFRHYVKNSKLMPLEKKDSYLNYLKYNLQLVKLSQSFNSQQAGIIKNEILQEKNLFQKSWLDEKLDLLEKRSK
jgi:hypothetical protein